jgi:hypothetical protein
LGEFLRGPPTQIRIQTRRKGGGVSGSRIVNGTYLSFILVYIPVENHTKFQLKTIPLIDAYLHSFFTNEGRIKNDRYEYKTKDYSTQIPGW